MWSAHETPGAVLPAAGRAMLAGVSVFAPALTAHQGGWDEMLMVLGPILVFWLILRAARRRAERANEMPSAMAADPSTSPTPDPAEERPPA